jgi:hypothetical protein
MKVAPLFATELSNTSFKRESNFIQAANPYAVVHSNLKSKI